MTIEEIEQLEKTRNTDIEHEYTAEIVCPYCGNTWLDSWEYMAGEEDLGEYVCDECDKTYTISRNITIDYSTQTMEEIQYWKDYFAKQKLSKGVEK